jgi:hypothetical protein
VWSAPWRERVDIFVGPATATFVPRLPAARLPWRHGGVGTSNAFDLDAPSIDVSSWLAQAFPRGASARIVVADELVRYAWARGAAALRKSAERSAAAAGSLQALYGDAAGAWTSVLGDVGGEGEAVACGMDRVRMERITSLLAGADVRPLSIRPLFVDAFNGAASQGVLDDAGWFVVLEAGRATMAAFDAMGWKAVRSQRLAGVQDLPAALERVRLTQGLPKIDERVVVATRASQGQALVTLDGPMTLRLVDLAAIVSIPETFS